MMTDVELIKKEIDNLESLACEIEDLGSQLLDEAELIQILDPDRIDMGLVHFEWEKTIDPDLKSIQREAIRNYQKFYLAGLFFVKEFLPEKQHEFSSCYAGERSGGEEGIMDYLQLRGVQYTDENLEIMHRFIDKLEIQRSILLSIPFIAKIKEMKLREIISGDFVDREIEEAELLFKKGHHRAAGALAGVALERHLKSLCDKYQIDYQKKDTIEPLVEKLYNKSKIELSQMKNIQHLASIRDKCDHPADVEKSEIKELIERVKKFV